MTKGLIAALVLVLPTGPSAHASPEAARLLPPVDAPIAVRFQPPGTDWGPGHRGIDYSVPRGTTVRAAARGMVTFAGSVAGWLAVTVDHGHGLETSYSRLSSLLVDEGHTVGGGEWLGRAGSSHGGADGGLHFSVRSNGLYADPELFLAPLNAGGAFHLAPLQWRPDDSMPLHLRDPFGAGTNDEGCRASSESLSEPPNENIAVAIAGVASRTLGSVSAEIYEHGPEELGYPRARVYRFSYRGSDEPDLHAPYAVNDTFGDIRAAARKLRTMLARIAERHPGQAVDLIAHSQGGIVARSYLEQLALRSSGRLPPVAHLVTFASPHRGSPFAGEVAGLDATATGGFLLDSMSRLARSGVPIPDPRGISTEQLAPGSQLLEELTRYDVTLGTRVLSLAIANDAIVPADRSIYDGESSRVVGPASLNGHSGIVSSPAARSMAHAFLRDAPLPCRGPWDLWGPRAGRVIGFLEGRLDDVYGSLERRVGFGLLGRVGRLLRAERAW